MMKIECPECGGRGWHEGTGWGGPDENGDPIPVQIQEQCGFCGGEGSIDDPRIEIVDKILKKWKPE